MGRLAPTLFLLSLTGPLARAQAFLPPSSGGYVISLGLPKIYKPYVGFANGLSRDQGDHLSTQVRVGVFRDLMDPITELLGVAVEAYGGFRDVYADYGVRASAVSNLLCLGAGLDYDLRHGTPDLLLTFIKQVRRGGVLGRGSAIRLEWLPTRGETVNLALTVPVAQPRRGLGRPRRDHVELRIPPPPESAFRPADSALVQSLADVRQAGEWVNHLMLPSLRGSASDPASPLGALKARLAVRTADAEIRSYHSALTRAFALALSGDTLGARAADRAKAVLLESVLLPYNHLLGQRKEKDTTRDFGREARGTFARWLVGEPGVPADRVDAALYVFQALLDVVEQIRATNRQTFGDSRLVWLPLQLALLPEQYDEQPKVDALISRAVGESLTQGNRVWYIPNERFQPELFRSIARAQEYHVLWVHDFRGEDDQGLPDRVSVALVTQAYLAALRHRVEQFDATGRLPVYMIFLDQFYFEESHSRALLQLLENPLERPLAPTVLPARYDSVAHEIATAQEQLRLAVQGSRLLQVERAQYGEEWLRALVKVHVSITNPADPSFRSGDILPWIGVPDDVMRDHRKLVLYDVSEADPYRGMAMYTGMGVGKKYAGPAWEDRAIMLQGPAALGLRDKARLLLETQGIPAGEVPLVLRPQARASDYDARVQADIDSVERQGEVAAGVLEVHNNTGFALKESAVAEATLFNLMAPGGVVKVPDSIWLNQLFGSLLAGAALRGVHVLVIAPSKSSAPDLGWPVVALIHDLLSRFIVFQHDLATALKEGGGEVRVGLYEPTTRVDDLRARVIALKHGLEANQFLRDLYAFDPAVARILDSAEVVLGAGPTDSGTGGGAPAVEPKLHMKGFLYLSREAWEDLVSGGPMAASLREYLLQRARQIDAGPRADDKVMTGALERVGARAIRPVIQSLSASERRHLVLYLQVGSPNQDNRSMVMDGEAAVLVSGLTGFDAVPDYVLLAGLVRWVGDEAALDRGLPPPGGFKTKLARWVRMAL